MSKRAVAHAAITSQRKTTIAKTTPYAITAISSQPDARATFSTARQLMRMALPAWWCVYISIKFNVLFSYYCNAQSSRLLTR